MGSSDQTFAIFTFAVVEEDRGFLPQYEDPRYDGPFKNVNTFGETILKLEAGITGGWVHSVAFSPDNYSFVFSTHNGFVHFGTIDEVEGNSDKHEDVYICPQLPITKVAFINN